MGLLIILPCQLSHYSLRLVYQGTQTNHTGPMEFHYLLLYTYRQIYIQYHIHKYLLKGGVGNHN